MLDHRDHVLCDIRRGCCGEHLVRIDDEMIKCGSYRALRTPVLQAATVSCSLRPVAQWSERGSEFSSGMNWQACKSMSSRAVKQNRGHPFKSDWAH